MKKVFALSISIIWSLFALAGYAAAADTVPVSGFSQFITNTIEPILVSIVGTLTPILIALACRFIAKKTGINISQASQQQLEQLAEKSVLAVEEKATASLKTAGEKWTGYQKHQEALDNILALAPTLSRDQADLLVHWAVAKIPGLGATGVLGGDNGATDTQPAGSAAAAAQ